MRTETHICDICKQSKSKESLAKITIKSEGVVIKDQPYGGIQVDICPDCLRKKGFCVEHKNDEEVKQAQSVNRKTLEEKLFDILEDMGVAFVE